MAKSSTMMTADQLREAERRTMISTPESVLMDRAAAAVAAEARRASEARAGSLVRAHIVLLVGTGNNGGDALLAGALLSTECATVTALLFGATAHERGLTEFTSAGGAVVHAGDAVDDAIALVHAADCVIDGIVGLNSTPGLRPPADVIVAEIPMHTAVVAVDLPSGLDPDSTAADASRVHADVTVTFTALKRCLGSRPASASAGLVVLTDVGVELD
jgi:hydroxyethylthiazole kinase-like uncharacterized protein yjeF